MKFRVMVDLVLEVEAEDGAEAKRTATAIMMYAGSRLTQAKHWHVSTAIEAPEGLSGGGDG